MKLAPVLVFLLLLPVTASAQEGAVIEGVVLDADTEAPVSGAELQLLDSIGQPVDATLGDEEGRFELEGSETGLYTLLVRRVGYVELRADSVALTTEGPTEVEVRLGVRAVVLDPVVVVGRPRGEPLWITRFRDRAERNGRTGFGRIYTRDDLDRINPITAQQMLFGVTWRGRCRPVILLDGLPAEGMLNMVRGEDLEGVEIYRGVNQIPAEFYRPGMCALAMFWTRADVQGKPLTWRRAGILGALLIVFGALASWL